MVLSQQFKPSEIFSSDNKLVQLSEKLMMEILEEPQHEEQRPSPEIPISNSRQLTPQMIQHMTVFYTSVLNMNILNFDETVVEITKSCEHVDNYGRSYQFIGKGCKNVRIPLLKFPALVEHFLERLSFSFVIKLTALFINGLYWIYFHYLRKKRVFSILKTRLYVRDCVIYPL